MKLAQVMLRDLDDPRLDGVHVTRVEMTPDLSVARVFWRATPGAASPEAIATALRTAAGYLRKQIGRSLRLRGVPELDFRLDDVVDEGARIEDLLAGVAATRAVRPDAADEPGGGGDEPDGDDQVVEDEEE